MSLLFFSLSQTLVLTLISMAYLFVIKDMRKKIKPLNMLESSFEMYKDTSYSDEVEQELEKTRKAHKEIEIMREHIAIFVMFAVISFISTVTIGVVLL